MINYSDRSVSRSARRRRLPAYVVASGVAVLIAMPLSFVAADDAGEAASCQTARCAAKAEIDKACPCGTTKSSDDYASCVTRKAKQLSISEDCREEIVECAANSTCGRSGAVACLVPAKNDPNDDELGGCTIQESARECQEKGGMVSGRTDCCRDCPVCAGGSCAFGGDCTSQFCQGGVCQPVTAGGSCVCGGDCTSQFCNKGVCQKVCAPGGFCGSGDDCTSQFCQGGVCQPVAAGGSCVCGGDCTSQHCQGGTCQPNCAGGACVFGGDCSSHFCLAGVCQPVFTGGSCGCGGDCLSHFCNNGVCG